MNRPNGEELINYKTILLRIATNHNRIKTESNICLFDYSLIIADLFDYDKEKVFMSLMNIKKDLELMKKIK